MTVVAVHPDSASLELHLDIRGEEFRKLGHLLTLSAIECYGWPSERALDQLQNKAAMLGRIAPSPTVAVTISATTHKAFLVLLMVPPLGADLASGTT